MSKLDELVKLLEEKKEQIEEIDMEIDEHESVIISAKKDIDAAVREKSRIEDSMKILAIAVEAIKEQQETFREALTTLHAQSANDRGCTEPDIVNAFKTAGIDPPTVNTQADAA